METRIEVFSNSIWQKLELSKKEAIKYNALINRIGKIESREISHTNTFTLPNTSYNIQVLNLHTYNPRNIASALNVKFRAKYYIEDKLLQEGFLLINNMVNGINVNFVDESLDIISKWNTITYQQLLQSNLTTIPDDYQTAISELREYVVNKISVLPQLSDVGVRGYRLATYPNSLNSIGDKFQLDSNDLRVIDTFNPYQNRPVYNVKAFLDIICETYGYSVVYDIDIDWTKVEKTSMISSDMLKNDKPLVGLQTITHPSIYILLNYDNGYNSGTNTYSSWTAVEFRTLQGRLPYYIENWTNPPSVSDDESLIYKKCIYYPKLEVDFIGDIDITATWGSGVDEPSLLPTRYVSIAWTNSTSGDPVVHSTPVFTDNSTLIGGLDITISKSEFSTVPAGAADLIGLVVITKTLNEDNKESGYLLETVTEETYTASSGVTFDKYGQYGPDDVDLTHAAPQKNVKELLSAIMHKEGLLININNKDKIIKFFSYGSYKTQKSNGIYYNWSDHIQKYSIPEYNTDYGDTYGQQNNIGLNSPFPGNTYSMVLQNQGLDSKYKSSADDYSKVFKDVENVKSIPNTISYFEYENKGLGLIEDTDSTLDPTISQKRADGTTQGTITSTPSFANVNYSEIPNGVAEWYSVVDKSVKVTDKFLLPVDVVRNMDFSVPVYIEKLRGFYIVEEISEYVNHEISVDVKLIKLLINDIIIPPGSDTVAPNIGTLSVGATVTETQIQLDWTAASDNVGVTAYKVFKDGVLEATLGNVLTYTVIGLTEGVSYSFKIKASDAALNESDFSNTITQKTVDSTAPVIGILSSTGSSNTTVDLAWTAATDNVGVTSYEIWQDNVLIDTITNVLLYTVTGLAKNTAYDFKIRAKDLANNISLFSNILSVTTDNVTIISSFEMSGDFASSAEACAYAGSGTTRYTDGDANAIVIGDTIYTDSGGTTIFNGNNLWYKNITAGGYMQVGTDGIVDAGSSC